MNVDLQREKMFNPKKRVLILAFENRCLNAQTVDKNRLT
jgi:hypothetical protein